MIVTPVTYELGNSIRKIECDICHNFESFIIYSDTGVHGWACCEACFNMWIFKHGTIGTEYVVERYTES